ncbi:NADP-dependent oxidoreductase [Flavobacteriaceae bacterium CRH]|nr:NADP-dependent oxidoreductase [Flavobacteriaceae bacterium CRH]
MNDGKSYVPSFELNRPIQSAVIAQVMESKNADFKTGTFVSGNLDWKQYQLSTGKSLTKITDQGTGLSVYLGILGMTGLTAYLGLMQAGRPKAGETLVISGAAGAVGSVVGQIGKLLGCRVVGITGSDEKVRLLESKFKFDHAINYKTVADLNEAVKKYCPQGFDVYFDNVGGEISDAVLANINKYARLPVCGAISLYNNTAEATGPRLQPLLLTKSATMTGFIVSDFSEHFVETEKKITSWLKEGKLVYSETVIEGFENIPQAFLNLFEGTNEGKMIVKI